MIAALAKCNEIIIRQLGQKFLHRDLAHGHIRQSEFAVHFAALAVHGRARTVGTSTLLGSAPASRLRAGVLISVSKEPSAFIRKGRDVGRRGFPPDAPLPTSAPMAFMNCIWAKRACCLTMCPTRCARTDKRSVCGLRRRQRGLQRMGMELRRCEEGHPAHHAALRGRILALPGRKPHSPQPPLRREYFDVRLDFHWLNECKTD